MKCKEENEAIMLVKETFTENHLPERDARHKLHVIMHLHAQKQVTLRKTTIRRNKNMIKWYYITNYDHV